nr:MFS transporter [Halomarina sp. BND7]
METNDRAVLSLTMLGHAMVHTYELSVPLLLPLWMAEFDATAATVGLVAGAGYVLFGLGALPGGVLADALGRRPLIVACLVGMGASFLLLSVAPTLPFVALALVCWGLAASVYHPAGLSLISTGVEERGTGFAYHGMAGNLGIAVGPFAMALLLVAVDWRTAVAILAVPALVAAALGLRVDVDETAAVQADGGHAPPTDLGTFREHSVRLFAGGFALVFLVVAVDGLFYRGILTFLPSLLADSVPTVSLTGADVAGSRYVYAGVLMVGLVGQYAGGRLTDRGDVERVLALDLVALAVLALLFVPAANAGLLALLAVSAALSVVLFGEQPLLQATVAEHSDPGLRGLSYGFMYIGTFGVGAVGAAVAGAILTYADRATLFAVLAAVALFGAGVGFLLARR